MKNTWNPDLYSKAWNFATQAHNGQTYGGTLKDQRIPSINHVSSVAMEVGLAMVRAEEGLNADLAVQCALLHDVIEDTEVTYENVEEQFGSDVADGVLALSKNQDLATKQEQMTDSLDRIQQQPKEIWCVKMSDRITNLYHPPHYWDNDKKIAYQVEAKLILDKLGGANAYLSERLAGKISDYSNYID